VRLNLVRDGQESEKLVTRERIEIESVLGDRRRDDGSWDFLLQADPRIAYIRIELFGEKTVNEFKKAIENCNPKPQGLIIDLRDNTGGLLLAAAQICDLFLDDGPIVTTKGRDQRIDDQITADVGTILPNKCPIAILINENSASASEILAGCLKDRERATIVGTRSFGKGSVQNVIPIEGGNEADGQEWGIDPSEGCQVSMSDEQLAATVERFRERSRPSSDDSAQSKTGNVTSADPSIVADPQLKLALERIQSQLSSAN
jgi:carboxyl-terminal processing protease